METAKSLGVKRQAVVLIHGIGEQIPMETLRDFVDNIAPEIDGSNKPKYFSKPDTFAANYELRRLTATEHRDSFKTDYFEFYWAHLMKDTQLNDVIWWIRAMFYRPINKVPVRLRWIYLTFHITTLLLVALLIFLWLSGKIVWIEKVRSFLPGPIFVLFYSVVTVGVNFLLLNYLGDAVRYFSPRPRNIANRQSIREAGLDLLRRLHHAQDKGVNKYDRVVIVGHSLGSVIAYDILNLYWLEVNTQLPGLTDENISRAEAAAQLVKDEPQSQELYQNAQFELWRSQFSGLGSWRISDLITIGSPMAFAEIFLAENKKELERKEEQREFATCPPTLETIKGAKSFFSFSMPDKTERVLHHAAAFAMTTWVNLYFKNDFVGGPVENFGPGVENKLLESKINKTVPFVSHLYYWRQEETESIEYLKKNLRLRIFVTSSGDEQ